MEMIKNLIINNYKSINHLEMNCDRINVLVGRPNTGKSNILEALDLSYLSWMLSANQMLEKAGREKIDIKRFFRVNKVADLFHMGDVSKTISILYPQFSTGGTTLKFNSEEDIKRNEDPENFFEWSPGHSVVTRFDNDFEPLKNAEFYNSPIKPFRYKDNIDFHDTGNYLNRLMPPFGNNLFNVIRHNPSFRDFLNDLLSEYGFEISIDSATGNITIQLRLEEKLVHSLPYEAMAETLKRLIFYVAAVRSSTPVVTTFDEPDANAFPSFVSFLADEITENSTKQFFITTHNPYLLNNFIENTPTGELAIFVCGYDKTKGTVAKRLSNDDLSELLDYGVDIFFNINQYLNEREAHSA